MTKTTGSPFTKPAREKEPAGRLAGADGAADGAALLLGTGRAVPVTVDVTVAVVVSVT